MEWITTSTVLERLRDGEERDAWRQFVERFRAPVERLARRAGLADGDAEDATQETFLAFLQAFRDGRYDRDRGRLSQWLFGIAYHRVLGVVRKRRRDAARARLVDAASLEGLPGEEQARSIWNAEWEQSLLAECLRRARAEFRSATFRAFELSVREKRPAAAVAAALGVDVKAVYNAKHRVLRRIRELRAALEEVD